MPAELEAQRRAALAAEPAPAENTTTASTTTASLGRIVIETPPAPPFDLSILEREKRPVEEPAAAPSQMQAGPIIIERPAPPEFDLSSLKIEPPARAERSRRCLTGSRLRRMPQRPLSNRIASA